MANDKDSLSLSEWKEQGRVAAFHVLFHLAAAAAEQRALTDAEAEFRKAREEVRAYARERKATAEHRNGLRLVKPMKSRARPRDADAG